MRSILATSLLLFLVVLFSAAAALKESDFRNSCSSAAFCRRQRQSPSLPRNFYFVDQASVESRGTEFSFTLVNRRSTRPLSAVLTTLDGSIRFRAVEAPYTAPHPQGQSPPENWDASANGEWQPLSIQQPIRARFEANDALVDDLHAAKAMTVLINYDPFRIDVKRSDGSLVASVNSNGLLHFESFIPKERGEHMFRADWGSDFDTRDLWEERFNSHTDPKPHGPAAVGLDVFFPSANVISGLPSRTVALNLPATRGNGVEGKEPYRMFNLDVFEYALNHNMGLYGSIPFVFTLDSNNARAAGSLWLNAAETFVDVEERDGGRDVHFMSETGVVDLFISVGPTPSSVMKQYSRLTGTQSLPPVFSLGYHQCRWNYRDEADVDAVHAKFDEHDIPVDVIWLDIEHTNGKRYFTWDSGFFPNPSAMQHRLADKGRKMVTIVDPHIKVDDGFSVYKEAKDAGFYVMRGSDKSQIANGHCWSGDSAYLDFSNPAVRQYWAKQFTVYPGATEHLFTWNDMNEPSVFNGPEISMPRDNIHFGDVEHRENHNMYGFYMTMATHAGHLQAHPNRRPFILSRSFFAGSQRHVAIWTGDNDASWEHLQASIPMVLAHNMAGLPFAGADTGGFFRNPEPELLVRWYQTAAWHPFFRGHAHLETKRREPWLFGEENTARIRAAIRRRYDVMPYLYTLFHDSSVTGAPIARPLYYEFPYDTSLAREEKLFMLGPSLLVSPIVNPGVTTVETSLPVASNWYTFPDLQETAHAYSHVQDASLDHPLPVFQRGGSIIPRRTRARRSTSSQRFDPFTLNVAPDAQSKASGSLYIDDGATNSHLTGTWQRAEFSWSSSASGGILTFTAGATDAKGRVGQLKGTGLVLERVYVPLASKPSRVALQQHGGTGEQSVQFVHKSGVVEVYNIFALVEHSFTLTFYS